MALVGNILLGTGAAPGMSSIASAYAESAASSRIPWSALEYSGQTITAISGSAIGGQGGTDSATVSAIASAYAESATSGKLDSSASSMFQPSGQYQTAGDYAYNSSVSSKLDASASSQFAPSGDYADKSALSSYVPVSASGQFAPSGDYAYNSALIGKLDASASSQFQPSGNYQAAGNYMSATESSSFYPMAGNPSGFLTAHQSLAAYQDRSSISAWTGDMSSISGKLDQSAFTSYSSTVNNNITSIENNITAISSVVSAKADASAVHTYTGIDPIVVDNENDQISLSATAVHFDSTMTAYVSGGSGFVGVNTSGFQPSGNYQTAGNYMSATESSAFYPMTGNPSGFLTAHQSLVVTSTGSASVSSTSFINRINGSSIYAARAAIANEAKWAPIGDTYVPFSAFAFNSSVSSKLDASASSDFYSTSNPSGFLTSSYTPTFGYDDGKISSIDGSALAGDGGGMTYTSPSGTIAVNNVNGTLEIWNSALAVTEHITAGQTSYLGSSNSIWTDIYRSGVDKPAIPAGTNILYMVQLLEPLYNPDSAYSLEIRFTGDGAQTYVVSATDVHFPSAGGYTGSAMFSSDMNISVLGFRIAESEAWYPTASASVTASSIVYPQTAYETSVQELALASQVPAMSAWQSLTAWAVAQGWTP